MSVLYFSSILFAIGLFYRHTVSAGIHDQKYRVDTDHVSLESIRSHASHVGGRGYGTVQTHPNNIHAKKTVADRNLEYYNIAKYFQQSKRLRDGEVVMYNPGDVTPSFVLDTLAGKLMYPDSMFANSSITLHLFDPDSAFLLCMWMSDETLMPLFTKEVPDDAHFVFIPKSAKHTNIYGAAWMKKRLHHAFTAGGFPGQFPEDRFHFAVEPLADLGNFLPVVYRQWQCVDHLCGLDQVLVQTEGSTFPVILKQLNARYDWLPSPGSTFGNKTQRLVFAQDGCEKLADVNGSVALVTGLTNCSYFDKITAMQASGAVAVVLMAEKGETILDLNCNASECATDLHIPMSMVPYDADLLVGQTMMKITYQNTPSENFFIAIDKGGNLAEVGWFLYPTMSFLVWQAQWFQYKASLSGRIKNDSLTVDIFTNRIMQGQAGVQANVTLPPMDKMKRYSELLLDMSLSCPGTRDTDCGHWDYVVNLFVCCDTKSPLCDMELGRWITPFRRRIGRWLTDVSPLLPLLANETCRFTMKTTSWARPWIPSLKLHFQGLQGSGGHYPSDAFVLYEPGATFDKNYNTHFPPYTFHVPDDVVKVKIFAVITGHGSDENGCGEFCVTSHHFSVNRYMYSITFSEAGTPLGCANQTPTGVEPNEHGTWLYGRNGWCDGRNVFPWVIDATDQAPKTILNSIRYLGLYNGTDPDPKQNPGQIRLYSYLIFYKELL